MSSQNFCCIPIKKTIYFSVKSLYHLLFVMCTHIQQLIFTAFCFSSKEQGPFTDRSIQFQITNIIVFTGRVCFRFTFLTKYFSFQQVFFTDHLDSGFLTTRIRLVENKLMQNSGLRINKKSGSEAMPWFEFSLLKLRLPSHKQNTEYTFR